VIGPKISDFQIAEVHLQVDDQIKKDPVLARIASDTVASELAIVIARAALMFGGEPCNHEGQR